MPSPSGLVRVVPATLHSENFTVNTQEPVESAGLQVDPRGFGILVVALQFGLIFCPCVSNFYLKNNIIG